MVDREDRARLGAAGLRTFRNIARQWSLSRDEQVQLLGPDGARILDELERDGISNPGSEALERISLVLGIYAALESLLPQRGAAWIRRPNSSPVFGNRAAIELMLSERLDDLRSVRKYLDAQFV